MNCNVNGRFGMFTCFPTERRKRLEKRDTMSINFMKFIRLTRYVLILFIFNKEFRLKSFGECFRTPSALEK